MWIPESEGEILASIEAGGLIETATFDAKVSLPTKGKSKDLAIDVAAMANDGGTLLYGVGEDEDGRPKVGTLVAIAGLHVLQRERYGRLGVAGSLTAFVGHALLLVAAATTTLAGREALGIVFLLGSLVALVGLVLLGATTLRARVLPWWCGVLLIIGLPLTVFLDIVTGGAGGILLGVVWALVGYALLATGSGAPAQQPSRVS